MTSTNKSLILKNQTAVSRAPCVFSSPAPILLSSPLPPLSFSPFLILSFPSYPLCPHPSLLISRPSFSLFCIRTFPSVPWCVGSTDKCAYFFLLIKACTYYLSFYLSLSLSLCHDGCLDVSLFNVFNAYLVIATTPIYISIIHTFFTLLCSSGILVVQWGRDLPHWLEEEPDNTLFLSISLLPLSLHDYSFFYKSSRHASDPWALSLCIHASFPLRVIISDRSDS